MYNPLLLYMYRSNIVWTNKEDITKKYRLDIYYYWCNVLWERVQSVYKITMPEYWDKSYFYEHLFLFNGDLAIIPYEGTAIPQVCTYKGRNVFDRPTTACVYKDNFDINFEGLIDKDCAVIHPFEDHQPHLYDIICYYAHDLSLLKPSIDMSILNSRLAYVFAAKDKASAETIKAIMQEVYHGNPAVTYDKLLGKPDDRSDTENWNFVQLNAQSAYLVDKLLADVDTVLRQFDAEIGLPTTPNKKERLITDEVSSQNINNFSLAESIKRRLSEQFEIANRIFPDINLSIEIASDAQQEKTIEKEGV